ncbi:MAG: ureidoglycolate lyase [Rhodospirillaceae bacterium]|nr:ureidoglycolate lyase [Rhodospirillaceae bacterium]
MIFELVPKTLTKDSFKPFGQVIERNEAERILINEGTTERFHDLANVDVKSNNGYPIISIFRGQPRPQPIKIKMMERHPLGSQAFMPLQNQSYYVVVAEEAAEVNPMDLHVFLANGTQGVNYNRNIWHHPLLVSQENNEFLVIDRGGVEDNCEEHWFTEKQGFAELNIK